MLVRSPEGDYETIDFREKAPLLSNETMYVQNINLSISGGLAVGVPGELAGTLKTIHGMLNLFRFLDIASEIREITLENVIPTSHQSSC
jgi:gamma-glutamyltranspeptidase